MKLVTVPRAVPPHAHLRKPLSGHQEIALVARARHHLRELRHKVNPELHALVRRQRLGQCDLKHRAVVRRCRRRARQTSSAWSRRRSPTISSDFTSFEPKCLSFQPAPFSTSRSSDSLGFGHPGGFRLERIEIQMEGKLVERGAGAIRVGENFGGVQRVRLGVVSSLDLVGHNAFAQRSGLSAASWPSATPQLRSGKCASNGFPSALLDCEVSTALLQECYRGDSAATWNCYQHINF